MKIIETISVFILVVLLWISSSSFTPANDKADYNQQTLFKINRSRDANEIWYAINTNQNGTLNAENPIQPFWIKKTENNKIEPLTWIQNKYAYGIKVLNSETQNTHECRFQFVSYEKRTFSVRQIAENRYKVYANSKNKEIEVTRIFVQIDGGTFMVPSVSFVKLFGIEPQTGNEITETIYP